jgi:hypothetical protein
VNVWWILALDSPLWEKDPALLAAQVVVRDAVHEVAHDQPGRDELGTVLSQCKGQEQKSRKPNAKQSKKLMTKLA